MSDENNTILVVDDEQGILDMYKEFLSSPPPEKARTSARQKFTEIVENKMSRNYNLLIANSGEKAIELIKKEVESGRQVAAGFFDMKMPGGLDGLETIKRIREIDKSILCLVVTAYQDRSIEDINRIFYPYHEDEWDYLNKPFTKKEILQKANNLISSWKRRRKEETYKEDLRSLIDAISTIKNIKVETLFSLLKFILKQIVEVLKCENSFLAIVTEDKNIEFKIGTGKYENTLEDLKDNEELFSKIIKSLADDEVTNYNNVLILPMIIMRWHNVVVVIESPNLSDEKKELIKIYINNAAISLNNAKLYIELEEINKFLEEKVKEKTQKLEEANKRLEKLVQRDYLTGLYNHMYFQERLKSEFSRAKRFNQNIALLFCDVDNFKAYNDINGHPKGDSLLKAIASLLCGTIEGDPFRDSDIIARYGGDEFVVILPQTDKKGALIVAERIQNNVRAKLQLEINKMPDNKQVSLSIGIAEFPQDAQNIQELVDKADQALFISKKQGKDKITPIS